MEGTVKRKKIRSMRSVKTQDLLFYLSLIAWPVIQFLIFYVAMNINSIMLSFQDWDAELQRYVWVGLDRILLVFQRISSNAMFATLFRNSAIIWIFNLTVGLFLGVVVAYYIYKKCWGWNFFKVLLFAPAVISGLVILSIFKQLADAGLPVVLEKLTGRHYVGLLTNADTAFVTILIYNVWFGVGGNMLLYLGTMDRISDSVIESARLEGAGFLREFFSITMPLIYPTFVVFVTVGFASFFGNDMGLYAIYGIEADSRLNNIGYYLYVAVLQGTRSDYTFLSAMGLVFTAVVIPVTLLFRWGLNKIGPSTD